MSTERPFETPVFVWQTIETESNSTFSILHSTLLPPLQSYSFEWHVKLSMALSIIILVVGIVGNTLAFVVMRRRPFLASSACIYLPCMALFDSVFLVSGITHEWTSWFKIDFVVWLCRIYRFINYCSGDISIWVMVAFTFDRFIAVCFPFKKKFFCDPRKAVITVVVVCFLGAFKNIHLFWTRGQYKDTMCGRVEKYFYFEKHVRPWIVLVSVSIIPFISIIVFNASIVHHLLKSVKARPKSFAGRTCSVARPSISHSGASTLPRNEHSATTTATRSAAAPKNNKAFYQTTAMCLSVSFTFLLCLFPTILLQLGKPYWKKMPWYAPTKNLNVMLVFVNHSINFYLYCLTGMKFRAELKALFKKTPRTYSIFTGLNPKFTHQNPSILVDHCVSSTENQANSSVNPVIALAVLR